jgi:Transglycosylase SLT domain/Domain of unknown function (DUF4124)
MGQVRLAVFVLSCTLGWVAPAFAQIYSWRDADGVLVLSDHPRPGEGEMATYTVAGATSLRATKPLPDTAKSHRYDDIVEVHATKHGLSPDLVRAVIQVESAFDPTAVSPKGAMGLMQLMPATAREYGVTDPFHPEQNIRAGTAYLKRLLDRYDRKIELALAAYNAGPGNVEKYGDVPPFRETQNYVKKIAGAAPPVPLNAIYKWMEVVDGRPVYRYSNTPPKTGPYEIVGARR